MPLCRGELLPLQLRELLPLQLRELLPLQLRKLLRSGKYVGAQRATQGQRRERGRQIGEPLRRLRRHVGCPIGPANLRRSGVLPTPGRDGWKGRAGECCQRCKSRNKTLGKIVIARSQIAT